MRRSLKTNTLVLIVSIMSKGFMRTGGLIRRDPPLHGHVVRETKRFISVKIRHSVNQNNVDLHFFEQFSRRGPTPTEAGSDSMVPPLKKNSPI